jgi:GNAT superfamily N-acetyltransferase
MPIDVRLPSEAEVDALAKLWHDGWQEAHADIVPAELVRLRTLENFGARLHAALPNTRVVGPVGAPAGLCTIKHDELEQLYVAKVARGSGVAAALMADGESRLAEQGVATAWLACAIGNRRAARFYEKCGWQLVGTVLLCVETSDGEFPLDVWRYEKRLARR